MRDVIFWLDWIGDTALADSLMEYAEPPAGMATIENNTTSQLYTSGYIETHLSMSCVYIMLTLLYYTKSLMKRHPQCKDRACSVDMHFTHALNMINVN